MSCADTDRPFFQPDELRLARRLDADFTAPDRPWGWDEDRRTFLTNDDFRLRAFAWREAAQALRNRGFEAVLLHSEETLAITPALFGCWSAGLETLLTGRADREILEEVRRANPRIALGLDFERFAEPGDAVLRPVEHPMLADHPAPIDTDRVLLSLWTSGSTGEPKRVPKRLSQFFTECEAIDRTISIESGLAADEMALVFATVTHQHIYGLLFREASLVMLVALALAAIMLTAAAPLMENIMGISLSAMMVPLTWIVVTAVVVLVLVSTALVPGWLYMKIPVTAALRNWSDSRRSWKHSLLITQFTVNVLMFGMLLAIASQYNKVTNGDPGYDYDNVYYVFTSGIPETTIQTCMAELAAVPGIADVQRCSFLPLQFSSGNNIYLPDQNRELLNIADQYYGTSGFFDFFGIPIVEGRAPAAPKEIAVSRSFVSEMARLAGWADGAVGKQVLLSEHSAENDDYFTICGVYEDYLIGSFNNPDERPSIRFWAEKPDDFVFLFYLLVKAEDSANGVAANVEDVVRRTLGENGRKVEVLSYEEQMRNLYSDNRKSRDVFIMGCIFSLLISIFGLVGYIASEANRRSKEIAIRKINGAKASDITAMFAADTLRMAAVAIIIGDILLYVAASGYLTLFPERVSLSAWNFVAADLLLALLATASAAICSYRISRANPVESIKNE